MALLSPSVVRLEQPLHECARIFNGLGCESVHVDVCQGFAFPEFFSLDDIESGALCAFTARVTMHLFRLAGELLISPRLLRETDLAVLHVFPQTTDDGVLKFLEAIRSVGCRPGLSLDLEVKPSVIEPYLPMLDTVFVMGIPVATHGFDPHQSTLARLVRVAQLVADRNPRCRLGLDGGVNANTFAHFVTLVDELVVGSLLLHTDDIVSQWGALTSMAKGNRNGTGIS